MSYLPDAMRYSVVQVCKLVQGNIPVQNHGEPATMSQNGKDFFQNKNFI